MVNHEDHNAPSNAASGNGTGNGKHSERTASENIQEYVPRILSARPDSILNIDDALDVVAKSRLYYALEGR